MGDEKKTFVMVDGSSYLFRAFHALPPLTNARGEPTGAVYGVVNMLNKLLVEHEAGHVVVLFDASGKTFRDEIFAEYKAQRPRTPDELRQQIPPLHDVVRALGLPLLQVSGVEADDVIGTLAVQAREQGYDTIISTIDKDMAQLVGDGVTLVNTMHGTRLDRDGVQAKFGVQPEQIVDYLALVGDTSDNIPGVKGVGQKTASALLQTFGTLEGIYDNLERLADAKVRGAAGVAKKLSAHREDALLSRRLATIRCDVALEQDPNSLQRSAPDVARLRELYTALEFGTLLRNLPDSDEAPTDAEANADAAEPASYDRIETLEALDAWIERLGAADVIALDVETNRAGHRDIRIVGLGLAAAIGEAAYLPLTHHYAGVPAQLDPDIALDRLRPLLEGDTPAKAGHDLKRGAHALGNHGIALGGVRFDTMLESYVLNSTAVRHALAPMALKYLKLEAPAYEDIAGKGARQLGFDEVGIDEAATYAARVADLSLALHDALWGRLAKEPGLRSLYEEIEQPVEPVLQRMEHCGVLIDSTLLGAQSRELAEKLTALEARAYEEAGTQFNLGSPKQLQEILFEGLGIPVLRKTAKGQPSTAEDVLEELADEHALPRIILEHRALAKLKSTYADNLPREVNERTGRVHTTYHQAVAATGRLSSSEPNLQNIPIRTEEGRRIRQAFVAPPGQVLLAADYSQIELRIMAHLSADESLLRAFADGRDIHQATAAEVFGVALDDVVHEQRRSAKAINFGLIYGMSAFGLARQLGIDRGSAKSYVDLYFDRYPGVKSFMDRTREQAREQGYVETVFGRRLYLPEINSRNYQRRQYAERSAINAPMQGTAADIVKRAMISVDAWLARSGAPARLIMQVHDELVLEVDEAAADEVAAEVTRCMVDAADLATALAVDVGTGANWDEAH